MTWTKVEVGETPTSPPPDPDKPYIWLGPEVGWKLVVVDDPEDRTKMPTPKATT